jgi:hypothetical protein
MSSGAYARDRRIIESALRDRYVARCPREGDLKNCPHGSNPERSVPDPYGLGPLSLSTIVFFGSLPPLSFASHAPRDQTIRECHAEENRRSDRHDQPKCQTSVHGVLLTHTRPLEMHRGFSARLRALRDAAPGLNQKLSSNHRPQMIIKCGAPWGRVVAIQYCRLFFRRSEPISKEGALSSSPQTHSPAPSAGLPRVLCVWASPYAAWLSYVSGIGMISTISIHAPGIICKCGWSLPNNFAAAS